jgi:hypothetical protein
MSETSPVYDAGESCAPAPTASDLAVIALDVESAWAGLTGDTGAWGELTVTFRKGRAVALRVVRTYKLD